ncbi:MAG TPA: FecR domain-containing protein, partial [Pirellulales bacterium]|nr:FecR domain-containing protein [Pirellulales bacterium]
MANLEHDLPADDPLLPLLGKLADGTAESAELAALEARLAADPKARQTYRRYLNLHVALRTRQAGPIGEDAVADLPVTPHSRTSAALRWTRRSLPYGWLAAVCVASASVLLVALAWSGLFEGRPQAGLGGSSGFVAHVTKAAHAHLAAVGKNAPVALTAEMGIAPGLLNLLDGFVELTFANGAQVVLEAPVEMQIVGPLQTILRRGRVVAHVPEQARGFAIETPRARVIDLGTEFGVGVEDGGNTEVQVFVGEVVAEWKNSQGQTLDRHLLAGGAMLMDGQQPPRGIAFQPEQFVRMFPTDEASGQPSGPMYNRSRFESVHVLRAPQQPVIDGDLADWDQRGAFRGACFPPYHDSHYVEGMMMYDERFVYIGAHVGDPAPMQSQNDPKVDPQLYPWRGGSVIVRLCLDPQAGWPLTAMGRAEGDLKSPEIGKRPEDVNEKIVHLTMWYYLPTEKPRLQVSFGMDFHGEQVDPPGWQGAYRKDPNGLGYTLEYAIPWSLLKVADRPPQPGDEMAA